MPASSRQRAGTMSHAWWSERLGRAARISERQLQAWVLDHRELHLLRPVSTIWPSRASFWSACSIASHFSFSFGTAAGRLRMFLSGRKFVDIAFLLSNRFAIAIDVLIL